MGRFLRKNQVRFDAREAFAERARKVNPRARRCAQAPALTSLINRAGQAFATDWQS
jgi:hypothetical protein